MPLESSIDMTAKHLGMARDLIRFRASDRDSDGGSGNSTCYWLTDDELVAIPLPFLLMFIILGVPGFIAFAAGVGYLTGNGWLALGTFMVMFVIGALGVYQCTMSSKAHFELMSFEELERRGKIAGRLSWQFLGSYEDRGTWLKLRATEGKFFFRGAPINSLDLEFPGEDLGLIIKFLDSKLESFFLHQPNPSGGAAETAEGLAG